MIYELIIDKLKLFRSDLQIIVSNHIEDLLHERSLHHHLLIVLNAYIIMVMLN